MIRQKDNVIAYQAEIVAGKDEVIKLKDQQLAEKDNAIAALRDADKASQAKATSAEKSLADCQQDRNRVIGERDSARRQKWLAAVAGAVIGGLLGLGR